MWYFALFIALLLGAIGQILFKYSANVVTLNLIQLFLVPTTLIGLVLYFLSAILYIATLKHIPLSIAYPTISLSYVVVIVISHFLFGELMTIQKALAMIFIISGVSLLYIK